MGFVGHPGGAWQLPGGSQRREVEAALDLPRVLRRSGRRFWLGSDTLRCDVDGVEDALGSAADVLALSPKLSFVGDVLKPALAVRDDPLPTRRPCRLLLLLPEVALPMDCIELRFCLRSLEFARCRSPSSLSKLWLLCTLPFLAKPG